MRKDWIMTEGEREEKRRKIQENRQKKKPYGLEVANGGGISDGENILDSSNECSYSNNGNEPAAFTDDNNNNSFSEANKNKPIRRRRRRRRHSQSEDIKTVPIRYV